MSQVIWLLQMHSLMRTKTHTCVAQRSRQWSRRFSRTCASTSTPTAAAHVQTHRPRVQAPRQVCLLSGTACLTIWACCARPCPPTQPPPAPRPRCRWRTPPPPAPLATPTQGWLQARAQAGTHSHCRAGACARAGMPARCWAAARVGAQVWARGRVRGPADMHAHVHACIWALPVCLHTPPCVEGLQACTPARACLFVCLPSCLVWQWSPLPG